MPLLKRKPYALEPPPRDLRPDEPVFQVRHTKEIFRDYEAYLSHMHLYRRRLWTCKVTGKQNLTYEEALVSERKATEQVQHFPKEFMGPVLSMVQFSPLRTDELVDTVYKEFKDRYVINEDVYGKSANSVCPCKILKVWQSPGKGDFYYEVGWLDEDGKKFGTSTEPSSNLMRKKLPFTRALLKAFIREAADCGSARNSVWVVKSKLSRKYKIAASLPAKMSTQEAAKAYDDGVEHATGDVEVLENGGHKSRKRRKQEDDSPAPKKKPTKKGGASAGDATASLEVKETKPAKRGKVVEEGGVSAGVDETPKKRKAATAKKATPAAADDHKLSVKKAEKSSEAKGAATHSKSGKLSAKATAAGVNKDVKSAEKAGGGGAVKGKASASVKASGTTADGKPAAKKRATADNTKSSAKASTSAAEDGSTRPVKKVIKNVVPAPVLPPPPPPIKYPIEDTMVKPCPDDPVFTVRPLSSTDFAVPQKCVGNLLMVWDFCNSFGKALHLSPFTLEEFEKSLDYRESTAPLLSEILYALLQANLSDPVLLEEFMKKRKRRSEISMNSWKDDVSDLLQLTNPDTFEDYLPAIRQGSFKNFGIDVKLEIFQELVDRSLNSGIIRTQIDENIGENQALSAKKREEDLENVKRRKQEKLKQQVPNGTSASDVAGAGGATIAGGAIAGAAGAGAGSGAVLAHALAPVSTPAEANGKSRDGDNPEDGSFSADENDDGSVGKNGAKDGATGEEDGQSVAWKTKGKRKLGGNHSPVNANGSCKKEEQPETGTLSKSRQAYLRQREALRQADEKMKSEDKAVQEKRKGQGDASATQEQIALELQKRQDHLDREMEKRSIRTCSLGKDRDHNTYWFFPREGRLFVQYFREPGSWGFYCAKEEFEDLLHSLNPKGVRERCLKVQVEKHSNKICTLLLRRSKEVAQKMALEEVAVRRSVRVRSIPRLPGFLAYVNKLR